MQWGGNLISWNFCTWYIENSYRKVLHSPLRGDDGTAFGYQNWWCCTGWEQHKGDPTSYQWIVCLSTFVLSGIALQHPAVMERWIGFMVRIPWEVLSSLLLSSDFVWLRLVVKKPVSLWTSLLPFCCLWCWFGLLLGFCTHWRATVWVLVLDFLWLGLVRVLGGNFNTLLMDTRPNSNNSGSSRNWNILNWNIRGINSEDKCNAIREKIDESDCAIFCIQETKREQFDHSFIRKLAPKRFNKFAFSPSEGASGGILMGWNSAIFTGEVIQINKFTVTVKFTSSHNRQTWTLSSVYGPCQGPERDNFVHWLNNLDINVLVPGSPAQVSN